MDRRLTYLLEHYIQTDDDREVANCLVEAVINSCSEEINQAIDRHLPSVKTAAELLASSAPKCHCLVEEDFSHFSGSEFSGVLRRKIKVVADVVANERSFNLFRSTILGSCAALLENLWQTNFTHQQSMGVRHLLFDTSAVEGNSMINYTKNQQYTLNTNTGEGSLDEFSFSTTLDQSVRVVGGNELESAVELIISDGISLKDRLLNIQKLLIISPSVLAKSQTSIESLLINFDAVLKHQILFGDAMCLLARLLSSKDEIVWSRVADTICKVAPNVLSRHKVDSASKIRFVHFFLQLFNQGPKMWRKFSPSAMSSVLHSFLDLFTSEFNSFGQFTTDKSKFLFILAHLEPSAEFVSLWLHTLHTRSVIVRKLVGLLEDFIGAVKNYFSKQQMPSSDVLFEVCFQACLLLRSIRHQEIFEHLESQSLFTHLSTILTLFSTSNQPVLNKSIQKLLLQFSLTHTGANYLVNYSLQNLLPPKVSNSVKLKLACNTLVHCSQPPKAFSTIFYSLIQLANQCLESYSRGSITCQKASLTLSQKPRSCRHAMVYQLFHLLLQIYPPVLLNSSGLHIKQLTEKHQKMDMDNSLHTSLLLSTGLLVRKAKSAVRAWRKESSKWLFPACLTHQSEENHASPLIGQLPHCLELMLQEEKRFAFSAMTQFLGCRSKKLFRISQLDFLFGLENHFLGTSSVVLIAQPGLAIELLRSMNLEHYLEERFNGVHTVNQIVEVLQSLHLIMANLEVVLELRRGTQLSGKLLQLLQKYCHSSVDNQLIVDELSVQVFEVLSSLSIRGGWRERCKLKNYPSSSQLKQTIQNLPSSLYLKSSKKNLKSVNKRRDSYADSFLDRYNTPSDSSSSSWGEEGEDSEQEEKERSRGLEESIKRDWLRLMSVDQGGGKRRRSIWIGEAQHRLIMRLFSRKRSHINGEEVNNTAVGLLKEYLKWMEKGDKHAPATNLTQLSTKMTPSQAEWLAPLLDYAVYGLGIAGSRQSARQKCAELKFVSSKSSGECTTHADWFLGVLFLSAGLDAKITNLLAEKLVNGTTINSLWPLATVGGSQAFNDTISTTVYPKVLAILYLPKWRWLKDWLCSMELPLLHLLTLYTHQLYLNLLNFGQIEEYMVLGVAAGSDFQAAHFLALLLHIAQSQVAVSLGRQLVHLSRPLRLQQFLHPNLQLLQVIAGFRFLHFLHLFQEEE